MRKDNSGVLQGTPKAKKKRLTREERAEISRRNGRKSKYSNARENQVYKKAPPVILPSSGKISEADLLADMYHPNAVYSPEQKLSAVASYVSTGTIKGTSRITGLPEQTIGEWRNKSQWWPTVYAKVKQDKQEELDARLTLLINTAFDAVEDRITNGNEVLGKDGEGKRILMSGKDLATTGAIMYDKRAMLRGDPTSISAKVNPEEMLKVLRKEFEDQAKKLIDNSVVKEIPQVEQVN